MVELCDDNDFILSCNVMLPADSFTKVSEAWVSVTWLDHLVSNSDFHYFIKTVSTCLMRIISPSEWICLSRTFLTLLAVTKAAMGDSAGTNLMQIVALNIVMFRTSSLDSS